MTSLLGEARVRIRPDLTGFLRDAQSGVEDAGAKVGSSFASAAKKGALAVAGITVAAGLAAKSTLDIGIAYQNSLNTLQAVSGATADQMKAVSGTAKQLGADTSLTATSAADAASAMTELAKAGFSVEDSQKAAKGSLQLAAAAGTDAATAATIQANAINAFSLKAADAGHVADVLANSANASSAEITDVAWALQAAGAVAHSTGVSIEDTAAAIGLLANNGIKGSDAGTLLKSALLALQSPSKPARQAMKELSLSAYDAHGNFVGLESIFRQLSDAQKKMTPEAYAAATSTLFGSDAARLAGIAGKEGAAGFDAMRDSINKQGSAAEVATAKSKGLGGAIEAFKSQVETFQIDLFERASPNIEKLVRWASDEFPKVGDAIVSGFEKGIGWVAAHKADFEHAVTYMRDVAEKAFHAVADYFEPITSRLGDVWHALTSSTGPASAFFGELKIGAGVLLGVFKAAQPLVTVAGDLLGLFTKLPGPVQAAVIAFGGLKVLKNIDFGSFGKNAKGELEGVTGALRKTGEGITKLGTPIVGFAQTVKANMRLAGDEVGVFAKTAGGVSAAFQTYMPRTFSAVTSALGNIKTAFAEAKRDARFDVAEQMSTSVNALPKAVGDIRGFGAAAKTAAKEGVGALRSGASGLLGVLGGPWGLAFTGATALVGAISNQLQQAKADAEAMAEATLKYGENSAQVRSMYLDQYGGQDPDWLGKLSQKLGFSDSMSEVNKQAAALAASMTPVERAQEAVSGATDELNDALAHNPPNSDAVASASERLRAAQANLASAQQTANDATKTHLQLLQEQANKELAAVSSGLAAQQSQLTLNAAVADYLKTAKNSKTTADELASAQNSVAQSALSAAQAAGQQAADLAKANGVTDTTTASQGAMLKSLQDVAAQMGDKTPKAITDAIAALMKANDPTAKLSGLMNDLGRAVTSIPNSKDIRVSAPTDQQVKDLQFLGYTVDRIPGSKDVIVHAPTGQAQADLNAFLQQHPELKVNVVASVTNATAAIGKALASANVFGGGKHATGGAIFGPGTSTSDSIPALLSNGEYVIKAKSVAKYGYGFLNAVNSGRFAEGGAVGGSAGLPSARRASGSDKGGDIVLNVTVDESKSRARDQIGDAMFELRRWQRGGRLR